MKKSLLVTVADKKSISKAKSLFASAHTSGNWTGEYMLLTDGITKKERLFFESKGILVCVKPLVFSSQLWLSKYECREFAPIVAHRFHLFSSEFKKWDVIVYLDLDIIVRRPINALQKVNYVAGVKDDVFRRISYQLKEDASAIDKNKFLEFKKIYSLRSYAINSGVLVFNTSLITDSTYSDLLKLADKYLLLAKFPDQLILNIFFYKKITFLSYNYNTFVWFFNSLNIVKRSARILHFAGEKFKPWNSKSSFYNEWIDLSSLMPDVDFQKQLFLVDNRIVNKNYLRLLHEIQVIRLKIKNFFLPVDRLIGQLGIQINECSPWLYKLLKRVF